MWAISENSFNLLNALPFSMRKKNVCDPRSHLIFIDGMDFKRKTPIYRKVDEVHP